MVNRILQVGVVTFGLTILTWWLTNSMLMSGISSFIMFYLGWFGILTWEKEWLHHTRDAEMYFWMQSFLTTLSVKKMIPEAYIDTTRRYQMMNKLWINDYLSNDAMKGIQQLSSRFHHPIFSIFISTLEFYEQQGGDVFTLFESIFQQIRIIEARRLEMVAIRKRYLRQWMYLWALNGFVLVMAKVVLRDLFDEMQGHPVFPLLMSSVVLYFPFSHLLWIRNWKQQQRHLE